MYVPFKDAFRRARRESMSHGDMLAAGRGYFKAAFGRREKEKYESFDDLVEAKDIDDQDLARHASTARLHSRMYYAAAAGFIGLAIWQNQTGAFSVSILAQMMASIFFVILGMKNALIVDEIRRRELGPGDFFRSPSRWIA